MSTKTLTLRGRGTLTLPKALRKKYGLEDGEPLTLIDLDGAFVLTPKLLAVPKLVAEMERMRQGTGVSVDELLEGLDEQREQGYEKRYKR